MSMLEGDMWWGDGENYPRPQVTSYRVTNSFLQTETPGNLPGVSLLFVPKKYDLARAVSVEDRRVHLKKARPAINWTAL